MAIAFRSFAETAATATSVDVAQPSGLADGDVLVGISNVDANETITGPSGWTACFAQEQTGSQTVRAWYKVITSAAGEPATYTFGGVGSVARHAVIVCYSGVDTTTPLDVTPLATNNVSSTVIHAAAITTVTANAWCVWGGCVDSSTFTITKPTAVTNRFQATAGYRITVGDMVQVTAGSTGSQDGSVSTARANVGMLIALRPASGGATPPTLKVKNWRFYSDATPDGSMTALAAENTTPTLTAAQMQNGIIRLRTQLVNSGASGGTSGQLSLGYSVNLSEWVPFEEQTPQQNNEGAWFRAANGAATNGTTIGSQLLTGTTGSGHYHETLAATEGTWGTAEVREVDFAVYVHWPPPDNTISIECFENAVAVPLDTGATRPTVQTCTAANRPYTITALDAETGVGSQKVSREVRFSAWERLFYSQTAAKWYFFTVQYSLPSDVAWYSWPGTGAWSTKSSVSFTQSDINQTRHAFAFKRIGSTDVVHAMVGASSSTRYGKRGVINSDGTISWGSEWSIAQTSDRHKFITVDDGGYVWLMGITAATGVWARRSTNADTGASWTVAWQAAKTAADAGVISGDVISAIGIASDKALLLWHSGTGLKWATVTDASGFSSVGTLRDPAGAEDWSFTRKGDFVFLICHDDAVGPPGKVWKLHIYQISTNTWTAGPDPGIQDQVSNNDGITISLNPIANEVFTAGTWDNTEGGQDRKLIAAKYAWNTGSEAAGNWTTLPDPTPAANRGNGDHITMPRVGANGLIPIAFLFNDDSKTSGTFNSTGFTVEHFEVATFTGQTAVPDGVVAAGNWTTQTGATATETVLDEFTADDTDYDQSSLNPVTTDTFRAALSTVTDPAVSTGHIVRYRYGKDVPGGDRMDLTVRLMQGATQIAAWTHTDVPAGFTTVAQTLNGTEADTITDYTNLDLVFEATKG